MHWRDLAVLTPFLLTLRGGERLDSLGTEISCRARSAPNGDFTVAADHARVALDLDPNFGPAYNNLGLALEGLKRNDEAVKQFRHAIELDPNLPQARLNLAGQLVAEKDFDGAEQQYARVIAATPEVAEAHYNYAVLLAMRRRIPEAVRECRAACALDPNDLQCQKFLRVLAGAEDKP